MKDIIKKQIFADVLKAINQAKQILVVTHHSPDGDALGSLSAFYSWIRMFKKSVTLFVAEKIPAVFYFLPFMGQIETDWHNLLNHNYDLIIILDCGEEKRAGLTEYFSYLKSRPTIINIDHHQSNNSFGNINLIDLDASSTTEILTEFFIYQKTDFNKNLATTLLFGIMQDTDFLAHNNTTERTIYLAGELIKHGASLHRIVLSNKKNLPPNGLRLWGKILSRLTFDESTGLGITAIFLEDWQEDFSDDEIFSSLSNFLNAVNDVKGIMVLKEQAGNLVKGSLRTTKDEIDVSVIASQYGGGGHKRSAGFITSGRIVKTEKNIWQIEKI
ncbi:MAG TPA: bifunctional oligoribonuclease/PAP phosphatase NrnA [bacterium]|nr:bifunctional oligoribonuclease/PAP phosphatase NrnA [bacterium]HPL95193.1 bifunctional oligoribonuclease/PAP phosphatase NrnA [bacterium]